MVSRFQSIINITIITGMLFLFQSVKAAEIKTDIVVVGGSFSASAAAFAAARTNPNADVLLLEPSDWLGGQATMQGVAAIDNVWYAPANSLMANNPELYYPADYLDWINRMRTAPPSAPGVGYSGFSGWVSRDCYDPRTGAWALDEMAAEFPNLTVMKMTVPISTELVTVFTVTGNGTVRRTVVRSISVVQRTPINGYVPHTDFLSDELPDWYSPTDSSRFSKEVHTISTSGFGNFPTVIDATETGDMMVLSGANYTQGREVSTEKVAEVGTLPAINDEQSLALVYPFAMTTSNQTETEFELKTPWPDFDAYLAQRTNDYFGLGSFPWTQVWTYRRLFTNGGSNSMNVINSGDVSMQNWNPGNDYRQGNWLLSYADTEAQRSNWMGGINLETLANAEKHATAWYFWMKERQPGNFPETDTRLLRGDDPLNMMGTAHGLAKFPYIRGTRRLVGLDNFRITSRDWDNTLAGDYEGGTSFRYYDSVGIGNYAADTRAIFGSTGTAPPFERPAPFYIPYRALASDNISNLLVSGKLIAQTYITNTAYRLHPIEWQSGSAAGTAAALMERDDLLNYHLLEFPAIRELQQEVALNAPIHWAYTGESVIPPQDGDLIINDRKDLTANTAFDVEAYHPTAVRAEIFVDGNFFTEIRRRANGRLHLQSPGIGTTGDSLFFEARLYDEADNEVALLSTTVRYAGFGCDQDPTVTDNDDLGLFTVSSSGWSAASSQPDRWCNTTYRFRSGTSGFSTATWTLRIPSDGRYKISIWYPASSNRATNSPFTVNHAGGSETFRINQRINGGQWLELGEFDFLAGQGTVVLSNDIGGSSDLVLADAVRAEPLNAQPDPVDNLWLFR